VENFGRLYGSNQPISAHFTAFNSSDQLQRKRSSIFQEALNLLISEHLTAVNSSGQLQVDDLRFTGGSKYS